MPVVSIRSLMDLGRAGNQLFTYCFAKGYAHAMGCELQVPADWWGRKVFVNATEPPCSSKLPQTECDGYSSKPLGYFFGKKDIDLNVFAQHQCYLDFYTRKQAREWLKIKPEFDIGPQPLTFAGYSAAHLRLGDYITDPYIRVNYCQVSEESYLRAVERYKIPEPILYVYEGWRTPPIGEHGLDWFADFLLLKNATYLLRANSTFSWWASVLGNAKTFSPIVGRRTGPNDVDFIDGNWPTTAGRFRNQSELYLKE